MNDKATPVVDRASARRGILWMILSFFLFANQDGIAKYLMSIDYSVEQVVWGRFLFHMLAVVVIMSPRLPEMVVTRKPSLQIARSLLMAATALLFYTGLQTVPLAEGSALFYTTPIIVMALSVPLLGEHVGPRRWAVAVLAFVGAIFIIRPGTESMEPAFFFPLMAACTLAFFQIATRRVSFYDTPMTSLFYTGLAGAVMTTAVVPFFWTTPDALGWVMMVVLGLFGGASHYCQFKAFEAAPAPVVAPFVYTTLLWATLYGFLLFGQLPDGLSILGGLIITGSGIYIFLRERAPDREVER